MCEGGWKRNDGREKLLLYRTFLSQSPLSSKDRFIYYQSQIRSVPLEIDKLWDYHNMKLPVLNFSAGSGKRSSFW